MPAGVASTDLAGRRLMIGTPMYEGMCHGAYAAALVEIALRLRELSVPFTLQLLTNQSSPERARTIVADAFLRSPATHLLFLDADMVVKADDVVRLLALQGPDTPYAVIGGTAPRKTIAWDGVARAATQGKTAGDLARFGGDIVLSLKPGTRSLQADAPCEVERIGGGFTMIRRDTFERLRAAHPELAVVPDAREREGQDLDAELHHFFAGAIDPDTRALVSEDFAFCDRVRRAGMSVWLCPWMHADHIGNFRFQGTLLDALKLNEAASATA